MVNTIKQTLLRKEYKILSRPMEMNIVGIRSYSKQANSFDDSVTLFYKDPKGKEQFHSFPATTDPGKRWLVDPMNAKGTAVLKEGQYEDAYMIGMHRRQYRGLIQRLPVTVYRDANKDTHIDTGTVEETGMFGINIHRAAKYTAASAVDEYSAGCQVFQSPTDFALFMGLCDWHRRLYGNVFTYTLLEEGEMAEVSVGRKESWQLAVGKTEKIESREQGVANWQLAIGREEKDGNLLHFSTSQLLHF